MRLFAFLVAFAFASAFPATTQEPVKTQVPAGSVKEGAFFTAVDSLDCGFDPSPDAWANNEAGLFRFRA